MASADAMMDASDAVAGRMVMVVVDIAKEDEITVENLDFLGNGVVLLSNPKDGLYIKAKEGIIKVLEIQGENGKKMPISDFLRGNQIPEFEVFE